MLGAFYGFNEGLRTGDNKIEDYSIETEDGLI